MFFKTLIALLGLCFIIGCGNPTGQTEKDNTQTSQQDSAKSKTETKNILFFGNSLTAGYGLDSPDLAFPSLIQQRIDSLGLPYQVINAGLSGETSAAGNERIDWLLNEEIEVFVLELGANDGLRGIPTEETRKNLQGIIDKVKNKYPSCKLVLTGMMVPPNMGGEYGKAFTAIFPKLAEENDMAYVPFLLESVAGETKLNQRDGIHPTEEGHKILAENVWEVLKPLL
ncbi:arylesterase [Parapedobacter tibetensis]|uniref:arylesterase n=1 Tax=Parapedobacter tibetensis TaxID=2972951 RepID=UPI00214D5E4B|nr:arylesterase [Parapedobacter tibetensis]